MLETVSRVLSTVLVVALAVGVAYFCAKEQYAAAKYIIVGGVVCLTFVNLQGIKRIKALWFEAEMRKTIDEANVTVARLKEISCTFISIGINQLTVSGRLSGISSIRKYELLDEFAKIIEGLGIEDDGIRDEIAVFHIVHSWDHVDRIVKALRKKHNIQGKQYDKLASIVDRHSARLPSVEDVREAMADYDADDDIEGLVKDYEYYLEHKKPRRFD